MRVHSLGARLALVAAGVLVAFFGLAGVALDRAYRASVDEAAREQLQVQLYLLLGAAELDDAGALIMPEVLAESRYVSPASGLLASVLDAEGGRLWSSASSAGHELAFPTVEGGGAFVHGTVAAGDGEVYRVLSYPVVWELGDGAERALVFQVAQSARDAESQVAAFRRTLWLWLAGAGAVLLLAQSVVLRWGLAPLRRVAREIGAIERGERERLGGEYPTELQALTTNLNALLASSASRLQRYRHALDDLAHSLKTPLAVLRGAGSVDRDTLAEQVARMDQAIAYHVQRRRGCPLETHRHGAGQSLRGPSRRLRAGRG
jgi:two-component system sensor histidine kinase PhoQ